MRRRVAPTQCSTSGWEYPHPLGSLTRPRFLDCLLTRKRSMAAYTSTQPLSTPKSVPSVLARVYLVFCNLCKKDVAAPVGIGVPPKRNWLCEPTSFPPRPERRGLSEAFDDRDTTLPGARWPGAGRLPVVRLPGTRCRGTTHRGGAADPARVACRPDATPTRYFSVTPRTAGVPWHTHPPRRGDDASLHFAVDSTAPLRLLSRPCGSS